MQIWWPWCVHWVVGIFRGSEYFSWSLLQLIWCFLIAFFHFLFLKSSFQQKLAVFKCFVYIFMITYGTLSVNAAYTNGKTKDSLCNSKHISSKYWWKHNDLNYEHRYLSNQISIPCIWFIHSVGYIYRWKLCIFIYRHYPEIIYRTRAPITRSWLETSLEY